MEEVEVVEELGDRSHLLGLVRAGVQREIVQIVEGVCGGGQRAQISLSESIRRDEIGVCIDIVSRGRSRSGREPGIFGADGPRRERHQILRNESCLESVIRAGGMGRAGKPLRSVERPLHAVGRRPDAVGEWRALGILDQALAKENFSIDRGDHVTIRIGVGRRVVRDFDLEVPGWLEVVRQMEPDLTRARRTERGVDIGRAAHHFERLVSAVRIRSRQAHAGDWCGLGREIVKGDRDCISG